jgi:hypothetical protein
MNRPLGCLRAALSVNRENVQTIHERLNSFKLSSISPPSDPHGQFIAFLFNSGADFSLRLRHILGLRRHMAVCKYVYGTASVTVRGA